MTDEQRVMFEWFRRFRPDAAPLTGAPAVRRQKSYSAQSGYVYQYVYEGQRQVERSRSAGTEYVFAVSADRRSSFPVSVIVIEAAVVSWERSRGRLLTATERYAIAKMSLFQAFDERESPEQLTEEVQVRPADVAAILETLGIE